MSIKHYGIYLAYPPTVDLRHEGLGRHLAAFLKGASEREDIRFIVVCPSWSKTSIEQLCVAENIPRNSFDIVCPRGYNILLRIYEIYKKHEKNLKNRKGFLNIDLKTKFLNIETKIKHKISSSNGIILVSLHTIFLVLFILLKSTGISLQLLIRTYKKLQSKFLDKYFAKFQIILKKIKTIFLRPKDSFFIFNLFWALQKIEVALMLKLINRMQHIKAWYSPTAFWPEFNEIKAPKLMCVPDVVLIDFPIGFSIKGGDPYLETFKAVESAIKQGDHYVTYSDYIKNHTLIDKYGSDPDKIHVIPHAPNNLLPWIDIKGYETSKASYKYSLSLLTRALVKCSNYKYASNFKNLSRGNKDKPLKFLFYASQFRPSKNILSLLRAYHYLLRSRYISHKLILTGKSGACKEIDRFLIEHNLCKDVLLLSSLSMSELAACYHLADLVINPSLSEGGFPFTFTEALSVNTPVIMANIAVTIEIITDSSMQEMMLFDPYDWHHLAAKTEWALNHREELLTAQIPIYKKLLQRNWTSVVNDYISVLDKLSENHTDFIKPKQSLSQPISCDE
jgi:glycosyltransferase involved in cell wall biosynthesis